MIHDVFISYSHIDKPTADAICAKLESNGLRCWYAPRDIKPGEEWATAIMEAIEASRTFVLVFTNHSNGSQQVLRELSTAVHHNIPIIPIKITKTNPSKGMEYYLATVQWQDATGGPLYENINALESRIKGVIGVETEGAAKTAAGSGVSGIQQDTGHKKKWINAAVAGIIVLLLGVILWQTGVFGREKPQVTQEPETPTVTVREPTEAPATDAPATEAPATEAPATEAPATEAPATEAPATEVPATEVPVTEVPVTEAPETEAPSTETPATEVPVTEASATEAPQTEAPTETPIEVPTEAPTVVLPEGFTEKYGLAEEDLPQIQDLFICGDSLYYRKHGEEKPIIPPDNAFLQVKWENLGFIAGMTNLEFLELRNVSADEISSVAGLKNLYMIWIKECRISDFDWLTGSNIGELHIIDTTTRVNSVISQCRDLRYLDICGSRIESLNDIADTLPQLRELKLSGAPGLTDLSPLARAPKLRKLTLEYLQEVADYSPLAEVKNLDQLAVFGPAVSDLGLLPSVADRLDIHESEVTDLTGLKAPGPYTLRLDSMRNLTSLNGIHDLIGKNGIQVLEIGECPNLTDWSALEGTDLKAIRVYGDRVTVPEELAGLVQGIENDGSWVADWNTEPQDRESMEPVSAESIADLQQMDAAEKKKIRRLAVAGDRVVTNFNYEQYTINPQWDRGYSILYDQADNRAVAAGAGVLTDLDVLEGMDNLEVLWLIDQPITSLEGIEQYTRLHEVGLVSCEELGDISPVYRLPDLQDLKLQFLRIRSMDGIEALKNLRSIELLGSKLKDLSALAKCDYSAAAADGGLVLWMDGLAGDYGEDLSFLKSVPAFKGLNLGNLDPALWMNELGESKIDLLNVGGCFQGSRGKYYNDFVEMLKRDHPELRELQISYHDELTDLSGLAELRGLEILTVSTDMTKAIQSLEKIEYRFRLDIVDW